MVSLRMHPRRASKAWPADGTLGVPHLASADELLQSGEIETVPYDYVLYCDTMLLRWVFSALLYTVFSSVLGSLVTIRPLT
jgi:hypothetical protein